MKRWESLTETYGLYQDPAYGSFSRDPVELVHFMHLKNGDRCLDLGTGNGIIPLYAKALYGGSWTGLDISREQLALAKASAIRNGFEDMIFVAGDVKEAPVLLGREQYSLVSCNPPYFPPVERVVDKERYRARHGDLDGFLQAAFACLKNGGRLYICYKAVLLAPLMEGLRKHRLEPKRMELLFSKEQGELVLLECKKLGGIGLLITKGER